MAQALPDPIEKAKQALWDSWPWLHRDYPEARDLEPVPIFAAILAYLRDWADRLDGPDDTLYSVQALRHVIRLTEEDNPDA